MSRLPMATMTFRSTASSAKKSCCSSLSMTGEPRLPELANQSGTDPITPTLCRKRSSVKWKNVVWPDPPEVLRKKQEKALRAEREKMAILDRPAYKAPVKRLNTPMDYSVQQSYAVNGGYYGAPLPTGPYRPAQPYAGPHNPQLQQAYGYQPHYPPPPPQQQQPHQPASHGGYTPNAPYGSGSSTAVPEPRFATHSQARPQPPSAYQPVPGPSMSAYYQQRQQEQQQERLASGGGGAVPPFLAARTAQMQAHQAPSFSGLQRPLDAPVAPRQEQQRPAGQAPSMASDLLAAAAAAAAARSASPATEAQA